MLKCLPDPKVVCDLLPLPSIRREQSGQLISPVTIQANCFPLYILAMGGEKI